MSEDIDEYLLQWADENLETIDDLDGHLKDFGRWDWVEIADEGRRVWNLLSDDEISENSPKSAILGAMAEQSAKGMLQGFAAMFGVDPQELMAWVAKWYGNQDHHPVPISPEDFLLFLKGREAKQAK